MCECKQWTKNRADIVAGRVLNDVEFGGEVSAVANENIYFSSIINRHSIWIFVETMNSSFIHMPPPWRLEWLNEVVRAL